LGGAAPPAAPATIEVVASDAVAGAFGPDPGRFAVVRTGDGNTPLTVSYAVSGSALAGVDYSALPGSVTLAAGSLATNVSILPLGGPLGADQVTVLLQLSPSPGYTLTSLSNATLVIRDRPVEIWRRATFTPAELANTEISGDDADWDADGLPTLMEYDLGFSPKLSEANPFSPVATNGTLEITLRQSLSALDVRASVEWSPDLLNWFDGATHVEEVRVVEQGSVALHTLRILPVLPGDDRGFLRFNVHRQ
jgi:hypothetical protein